MANPLTPGGTGNFQLISKIGDNILDQNLVFGVIGIADIIGPLTSAAAGLDGTSVRNAGEPSKYAFSFKVSQIIPAHSYFKIFVHDPNFGLSKFPSCSAYSINEKIIQGKLACETVGRDIIVRGLSADIPQSQDVGISVSLTNPPFSGITKEFSVAIYRNGTNAIYDRKKGIAGISITPGQLTNVFLKKVSSTSTQSRNKIMDYTLTFLPKNALRSGSCIVLTFPYTFTIDTGVSVRRFISSGLEDISEDTTVGMEVTSTSIKITSFAPITVPQLVTLTLRLVNPTLIGETAPIFIRTYTSADLTVATLIDEDVTNAITYTDNLRK